MRVIAGSAKTITIKNTGWDGYETDDGSGLKKHCLI